MDYNGNTRILSEVNRIMEEIALKEAADCLSWQEQKARYLASREKLTTELTEEIHTFRQQAYTSLRIDKIDGNKIGRYLI